MLMILLFTILVIFITYVYLQWIQLKQYWAKFGVAHISPHPLFGSMTFLTKENPSLWFRRMYDNFKYPYIGIWVFWRPGLLVHSPEIVKNILVKDQANFRNRLVSSGKTDPVGRLNIFSLNDPLWTTIRRRLSFLFTSSKLRGMQTLVSEKSKELVERIEKERQKSKPIDLRRIMVDFTTDVIGTSAFGVETNATINGTSHIRKITEAFTKFDLIRGLSWCSTFFIPELAGFFRFKMFPLEGTEYMRKILRKIIAERGGLEKKVTEPNDLLDILIMLKQDCVEELDMTEDMMLAQAIVFLQGGFDTTAATLSFAVYELAFCPEVQEKLYKELQEAKYNYGENLLDAGVLSQLTYFNCVINETLRKYPIFSWLDRIALENYKVDDHLTIKAGTPVYVNVAGMHYDPDFYPDPKIFNPDRFLPENKAEIKNYTFLPFGEGPRKCIGQRFGLSNVRHALAAVMLHFEVRPLPNTPEPSDVKLEKQAVITIPEEKISVKFIPRTNV